ncbi:MAG: hypothetical protein PUG48_10505 [Clostridia bacterium]|nr:hypothetical protein [Clostridia bacterium]
MEQKKDITIDRSLISSQRDGGYITRVPGTSGKYYLFVPDSDIQRINDGKTLLTSIDTSKTYSLIDRVGNTIKKMDGLNLYKNYYDPVRLKQQKEKQKPTIKQKNTTPKAETPIKQETVTPKEEPVKQEVTAQKEEPVKQEVAAQKEKPVKQEAATQKQEVPVKAETDEKSLADTKTFFDNFVAEQTDNQSINIAKAKDKISELEAKIKKAKATQQRQNNIADVCKSVIDSNAYPVFSPIVSAIAEQSAKSAKKKNKKIRRFEKKIKKQRKKIKKFERKLKRAGFLKSLINSMGNSDDKQTAFVDGVKDLQQDSLMSAQQKLDKINEKAENLYNKSQSKNISEADKVKIEAKIQKLKTKRDKLVGKINNLNELDQSLNKLAKTELVDSKVEELANTTIETAEKSAMKASSLSDVIDDIVFASPSVIDKVLNEDKEQKKDNSVNLEKNADEKPDKQSEKENVKQTEKQLMIEHPVRKQVTQQQMKKLIDSGMPVTAVKKDGKLFAVFEKADVEKVNKILSAEQKRTNNNPKR